MLPWVSKEGYGEVHDERPRGDAGGPGTGAGAAAVGDPPGDNKEHTRRVLQRTGIN